MPIPKNKTFKLTAEHPEITLDILAEDETMAIGYGYQIIDNLIDNALIQCGVVIKIRGFRWVEETRSHD